MTAAKRLARLMTAFAVAIATAVYAEEPKSGSGPVSPPAAVPAVVSDRTKPPAAPAVAPEPPAKPKTVPAKKSGTGAAPAAPGAKPAEPKKAPVDAKTADPAKAAADTKTVEPAKTPAAARTPGPPKAEADSTATIPAKTPAAAAPAPDSAKTAPAPAATTAPAPAKSAPAPSAAPASPATPRPATPAPSAEAEAVWHAYEKRWSETEDYSAGFRQLIEVPDIGSKVESAGRFYFAKPGLVRWDYTEGPPQTVVGDGTWIWLYQPDLEQVYKIPYARAFGRGGLVELLAGREGVSERYSTAIERPDATTVRILLKSLTEGGGDLEVTLEADTFDLRAVTVHDAAGSTTSMTFAEPQRNNGADRSRFTFTPPPAVDIISDNEAGF